METKSNEPAFASIHTPWLKGLTKREYFAAMALQGLLANDSSLITSKVRDAVKAADILIEEINKTKQDD